MIRRYVSMVLFGLLSLVLSANFALAQGKDLPKDQPKEQPKDQPKDKKTDDPKVAPNPAATPLPRDKGWQKRHEGFVEIAKKGDVELLFLGDSITDAWRNSGKAVWEKNFAPFKAANFGISGDQTQHVLWRIQNGELDGITPKLAVLMIGTNNLGGHKVEQIADGVTTIVKTIQEKSPKTKVLLLAIFPRGAEAESKARDKIAAINKIIAKLDNGKSVRYLDIGAKFTQPDGTLTKDIMPDFLHLSQRGYEIWAEAILPSVREMMGVATKDTK